MNKVVSSLFGCVIFLAGCADKQPSFTLVDSTGAEKPIAPAVQPPAEKPVVTAAEPPAESTKVEDVKQDVTQVREPDVIFVPTPQDVVDKMLELAQVTKDDLVYDLGCGDGRIVVTAAKKYGCKAVGYDIDPQRVAESLENVRKNNVGHLVRIEQKDIFTLDLSQASVVTLYLLPRLNVKLIPQLQKLKPGSRIVSHDFRMRGVPAEKTVKLTSEEDQALHDNFLCTAPIQKKEDSAPGGSDSLNGGNE
jgi:SAM-dependent methyltransferase